MIRPHAIPARYRLLAMASACLSACLLNGPSARAENTPNLLLNPGADTGDLSGWTIFSGAPHTDFGTFNPSILPQSGSSDFVGGTGPIAGLFQVVSISGFAVPFPLIDAGLVTANLSWFQQSLAQVPADTSGVGYGFHDASNLQIVAANFPSTASTGSWLHQSPSFLAPANSRSIVYQMNFLRFSGNDIDAYIDSNSLTLSYNGSAWNGSANDHLFNSPANWNSGVPAPAAAAVLTRSAGSDSVTFNANYAAPLSFLFIDAPAGMTLNQSANTMNALNEFIGSSGTGTYNQSGGINSASIIFVGNALGSAGTYNLTGGVLNADTALVGSNPGAIGTLNLSNGSAFITHLSVYASSQFNLSGGALTAATLGFESSSSFHWSGGTLTLTTSAYFIDNGFPAVTVLNGNQSAIFTGSNSALINGITYSNAALFIGDTATASFTQNGTGAITVGSPAVPRNLFLAPGSSQSASYTLSNPASSLTVHGTMYVNAGDSSPSGGTSTFNISNGSATIDSLIIRPGGSLSLSGGVLTVGTLHSLAIASAISWTDGTLNLTSDPLLIDPNYLFPSLVFNGSQSGTFTGARTFFFVNGATATNIALIVGNTSTASLTQNGTGSIVVGSPGTPRNLAVASNPGLNASYTLSNPATSLTVYGNLHVAGLETGPAGNATFSLSAGSATVTGTLKLWNSATLNLSGGSLKVVVLDAAPTAIFQWTAGSLTLLDGYINGLPALNVPPTGTLAGSGVIITNLIIQGNLFANDPNDELSIHGPTSGGGTITVAPNALLVTDSIFIPALSISGTLRIRPNAANLGTAKVAALLIAGAPNAWTAKLDLTNNNMIVAGGGGLNIPNQLKQGANLGAWNGAHGITSSSAQAAATASTATALAYATGSQFTTNNGQTTFSGLAFLPTDTLILYTLAADANMDTHVTFADFLQLQNHYNQAGTDWQGGDFNYDNSTAFADFLILQNNYNKTLQPGNLLPANSAPVPEPASLALLAAPALLLRTRRRSGLSAATIR